MEQALQILKKHWKHEAFRSPQEEIIASVLSGKDTFALLPTGGGKSVCYQIPGMMLPGITLVISPLIALIKDQVENLKSKDIKAIGLVGTKSNDEISDLLDNCQFGNYKFLYLSPERLLQEWVLERIKQLPIQLIAIDEAHCVSQWGHDFRPAYLLIKNLKTHFPKVPFLAVTASATERVQTDIITHLALENPQIFKKSFARENLGYHVVHTEDKLYKLQQIVAKNKQSSIVYVRNRKSCISLANQLSNLGFTSTYFHGGLSFKEKEKNMQLWLENKAQIIVATNAFGMGIDKPDVKTVVHFQLPENLENYYQEAGRAGRNGEKAYGLLLVSANDISIAKTQLEANLPDKKFLFEVYKKLNNYFQIAYGEGFGTSHNFNIQAFAIQYQLPVLKTINALQFLDRQGVVSLSNDATEKVIAKLILPSKEIIRYISLHPNDETVITAILRTHTGIFEAPTPIQTELIAKKTGTSTQVVIKTIQELEKNGCLQAQIQNHDSTITFNEAREDELTLNKVVRYLISQNELKKAQFDSVIHYVTDATTCKSSLLLTYFDEKKPKECGICSFCMKKQKNKLPIDANAILIALKNKKATSRELEQLLGWDSDTLLTTIQLLLENKTIGINQQNQFYLL
ncbi:MAG: RecQ family ATP-dependent DNA helicase [Flavobacterium sp.]|nr:RecQ family ATP-dependent DNA helicase [Flavobacterium sp.]